MGNIIDLINRLEAEQRSMAAAMAPALALAKHIEPALTMAEQAQSFGELVAALGATWPPPAPAAVIVREPGPPTIARQPGAQPPPQPITPVRAIVQALRDNTLSRQDRQDLIEALSVEAPSKRGQQPAPREKQIELNDRYEELKQKYGSDYSQEKFMRNAGSKIWECNVKTFERYRRNVKALRRAGII